MSWPRPLVNAMILSKLRAMLIPNKKQPKEEEDESKIKEGWLRSEW
jgi:hypothetical protein